MAIQFKPLNQCPTPAAWSEELQHESIAPRWLTHLEECSMCQRALEDLAADPQMWFEAQETLADRPVDVSHITESILPLSIEPARNLLGDPLCEYELAQLQRLLPADSNPPSPGSQHSYPPCEPIARIGRYDLEQLIGRGGMGLVFRAWDTQLHRVVAVKTLSMSLWSMPAARERFIREGRAAAMLNHPNIVPMYDVINEPPVPALVMQYIAGPTLDEWIHSRGPLGWSHALQIALQLGDALCSAHAAELVHRDIKPGNVLLEADGTRALLTDFGLVRAMDDATLTQSGLLAGTPHFMSPEQAKGEDVDGRSDLFSLGSLIYYAISGQTPFRGRESMSVLNSLCHAPHTPLRQLNKEVPHEVCRFVDRLLQKQPQHRPASSHEVRESIRKLLAAEHRLKSKRYRQPWDRRVVVLCAALLMLAVPIWMASLWLNQPTPNHSRPGGGFSAAMPQIASDPAGEEGSMGSSMMEMPGMPGEYGMPDTPGMGMGMGMGMGSSGSSPAQGPTTRWLPPDPSELDALAEETELLSAELDGHSVIIETRHGTSESISSAVWEIEMELETVKAGLRVPVPSK